MIDQIPRHAILSEEDKAMLAVMERPEVLIADAANETGLHPELLQHLVAFGILSGNSGVCNLSQAKEIALKLDAVRSPLAGRKILISDAAEKYNFGIASVYRWVKEGWIKVLQPEPRRRIDEGDIAFARALADLVGHVSGRSVFPAKPRSGRPKKNKAA